MSLMGFWVILFCTTQVQTDGQYSYLHNCVAFYAKEIQREVFGAAEGHQGHEHADGPNTQHLEDEYVMA